MKWRIVEKLDQDCESRYHIEKKFLFWWVEKNWYSDLLDARSYIERINRRILDEKINNSKRKAFKPKIIEVVEL